MQLPSNRWAVRQPRVPAQLGTKRRCLLHCVMVRTGCRKAKASACGGLAAPAELCTLAFLRQGRIMSIVRLSAGCA